MRTYSYLALGDSYTIGEQVRIMGSFPYQTIQLLRRQGMQFQAPEIIAVTGFTTDELNVVIDDTKFLQSYDFVSLLIGVNNQYRGRSVAAFADDLENLVQRAIGLASNNPNHVAVLSIPDWGVTPFAAGKDTKQIATEIDLFNAACLSTAKKYQVHFIDITSTQREDAAGELFVAADKLHPSAAEYAKWAKLLAEKMIEVLH